MGILQPRTLEEMIMPIVVANCAIGMGIWPRNSRWRVFSILYSILCLVAYCVLMKIAVDNLDIYYLNKVNDLGNMTYRASFYCNICLMLLLILNGWQRIRYIKTVYARVTICEKGIEQMGIDKNYRKLYLNQLYLFATVIMVMLGFMIMSYNIFQSDTPVTAKIILTLAINYPIGLLYVADISFLHWVRYSMLRFKQLNDLLQRMLTTTPDSPQHKRVLKIKDDWNKIFITSAAQQPRKTKDNTETMRAVKHMHLELIKSTRGLNDTYGIQILLSMTTSFIFITGFLYTTYSILWLDISKEALRDELLSLVCWILFYTSKVFIINHACALASTEAANTGDIICELYEPSTSKEFRAEIRDFTLQLIQNPLIFTACGFFNLDHTFIHGVIGSITTYLVILIQVGDISPHINTNMTMSHNTTNSV